MRLTARQLNRATLDRQLLLHRASLTAEDGVRRVTALQAQEPASPYLALWNRLEAFDPADLHAAFERGAVVKATLMRITLHAVHADDYPPFQAAMLPSLRASRLNDPRFKVGGRTTQDADDVLPHVLDFAAQPRTRPQVEAHLETRGETGSQQLWWAYRTFAPLHHAPTRGPWSFGARSAYVAAPQTLPQAEREASAAHLARRFLEGFGPATPLDLVQFTMLTRPVARAAFAALGTDLVEHEGPNGEPVFDLAGATIPDQDVPALPRLLPMWDLTLLAHADRSRIIPPEHRAHLIRRNGDVLPALLVDGRVAGAWRPVDGGIEATAFERLSDGDWAGLEAEARGLVAFLAGRDAEVYRRYGHWWGTLPAVEVRLLGG